MVLGFGNSIPPTGQPGPAGAVGQRPHMNFAGMVQQSIQELAVWSTLGAAKKPKPTSLEVVGAQPNADRFYAGSAFSWRGASAAVIYSNGSREAVELLKNPQVELVPGEGVSLVAGSTVLKATLTLKSGQKLVWQRSIAVQPDEPIAVNRPSNSFEPAWQELQLPSSQLAPVTVTLASGAKKEGLSTEQLQALNTDSERFYISISYKNAPIKTTELNYPLPIFGTSPDTNLITDYITGYRYFWGGSYSTAEPLSGWLTIEPPAGIADQA